MTIKQREKFFFLGLSLFYLIVFLAPNKPIYFAAYFVVSFFFYLASKDIRLSLLYTLILSFFSDIGLAGSLFLMEPRWLNLGSGYWISPLTVMVTLLLPLSLKKQIKPIQLQLADIMVLLFFIYCAFSFTVFPYTNVFFGIINLGEIILAYFLMRTYFSKENLIYISYILISMLVFQSLMGVLQFVFQRPLGILPESSTFTYPFGLVTIEEERLFRLTGTFGHPNYLASFLLTALPFFLLYRSKSTFFSFFKILPVFILVFTYSRAAWLIFVLMGVFILFQKKQIFPSISRISFRRSFLFLTLFFILLIFIAPYLLVRLETFPAAFAKGGSMDVRFKLWQEGLNLISQYPTTGVGLNRSLEVYSMEAITDVFDRRRPSKFYSIHNTFLEIAAEAGIPGALFFSLYLIFVVKSYFSQKRLYPKNAAFIGLLGLLGISLFNPFFHSSQFRLFFLLAAIVLV